MRCRMHLPHLSQHGKQQYGSSLDILTLVNIDTKKENSYTKYDIGISEDIGRGMLIPFVARIPLSNVGLKIQYVCSIVNQFFSVAFSLNLHASFFKISDYNQERKCRSRSRNEWIAVLQSKDIRQSCIKLTYSENRCEKIDWVKFDAVKNSGQFLGGITFQGKK